LVRQTFRMRSWARATRCRALQLTLRQPW
jgi:hypothetical protein